MLVAFGTLQSHTQEQLAGHGHKFVGLPLVAEDGHRPIAPSAALSGEQLAHELIVWNIVAEIVAKPPVEAHRGLDADVIRIGPQ